MVYLVGKRTVSTANANIAFSKRGVKLQDLNLMALTL